MNKVINALLLNKRVISKFSFSLKRLIANYSPQLRYSFDSIVDTHKDQECYIFGDGISIKWFNLFAFKRKPSFSISYLPFHKEVNAIDKVMKVGKQPVLAILGGAKVSSKITIIENMLDKIDHLIIGGGMVYTFSKAQGGRVGQSICEDDYCNYALELLEKAKSKGVEVHLPKDVIIADDFSNDANKRVCKVGEIPDEWQGLDAGPETLKYFEKIVMQSKTILWNGPLGVFEFENFSHGTFTLGEFIANSTLAGAFSLVGGGDSVAAVKQFRFEDKMSYISTGGGAMLESLEGKTLPGIAALLE